MVQNKGENMSKVLLIKNEKNQKAIGMENRKTREIEPIYLGRCEYIKSENWENKYIEFEFEDLKKEKLLKYHYLNTNSIVHLASPTLQDFFNKYAPNDVQFIPVTIITKDNKKVTDYAMINILTEIDGHDKEYTEYNYIDYFDDGNKVINGINKIKYLNDAMGEHLIGRDKFSLSCIVFSEKFRDLLKLEKIKLKDYKYYLPEEWYS